MRFYALAVFGLTLAAGVPEGDDPAARGTAIVLASTTSTDNSGLYEVLLPAFTRDTGITVRVIAVGTGRALNIASRGDADVLIVHDEPSELEFVRAGHGVERNTFMYNDYILVGPLDDVAAIGKAGSVTAALQRIAQEGVTFISRGDDSGTHRKELSLWRMALNAVPSSSEQPWYREIGRGMGATLNMANELQAYTLSDRSTWVSFNNRAGLKIIIEHEPPLNNPYSVILVNPQRHPGVRFHQAKIFADWLASEKGLAYIRNFRVRGEQLFFTFDE